MTASTDSQVRFDPYDVGLIADPYPMELIKANLEIPSHQTFCVGTHFCLGSALARLEGRIALEEILKRFPEWKVDLTQARLSPTSTVRGWESMPAAVSR